MNQIAETLVKLQYVNNKRIGIIMATHDMNEYNKWCKDNQIIAEGYARLAELIQDELEMNKETTLDHVSI